MSLLIPVESVPVAAPPSGGVDRTRVFTSRVLRIYTVEGLASISANLLLQAFFFYARDVFHWSLARSLLLSAGEGVVYILGALLGHPLSSRLGARRTLILLHLSMATLGLIAWLAPVPSLVTVILILYAMLSAAEWPTLEGLVSSGVDANVMSRRVGVYNLVWSGTNALTLAMVGLLIAHVHANIFLLPVATHVLSLMLVGLWPVEATPRPLDAVAELEGPEGPAVSAEAEPELLRQRTLALQLSRIALPATYVVLYSLVPMLPSLKVIRSAGPELQTVLASTWMISRFALFAVLGATAAWHTRPRLLFFATVVMLVAFLGVVVRGADLLGRSGDAVTSADVLLNVGAQLVLGAAMGMIYAGSLYFGMVLSDGSSEHGGYHEALIGVGQVVGPGAGWIAAQARPGDKLAVVAAVSLVVLVTVIGAAAVTVRPRPQAVT